VDVVVVPDEPEICFLNSGISGRSHAASKHEKRGGRNESRSENGGKTSGENQGRPPTSARRIDTHGPMTEGDATGERADNHGKRIRRGSHTFVADTETRDELQVLRGPTITPSDEGIGRFLCPCLCIPFKVTLRRNRSERATRWSGRHRSRARAR